MIELGAVVPLHIPFPWLDPFPAPMAARVSDCKANGWILFAGPAPVVICEGCTQQVSRLDASRVVCVPGKESADVLANLRSAG